MKKVHLPASLQPFTQPNVCVIAKLSSGSRDSQLSLIACVGKGNVPTNVHWTHQFNWNWFLLLAGAVSLTRTRVATSKNEIFHKYFIIIWPCFVSAKDIVSNVVQPDCVATEYALQLISTSFACIHRSMAVIWIYANRSTMFACKTMKWCMGP